MKVAVKLLNFYQKFLTLFSYGSCRYYPTCSEYAKWQFENNNFISAFISSFLRILRCNQLFRGGIDYPIVNKKFKKVDYKKIKIVYWFVPINNNKYYIIKNRKWK